MGKYRWVRYREGWCAWCAKWYRLENDEVFPKHWVSEKPPKPCEGSGKYWMFMPSEGR